MFPVLNQMQADRLIRIDRVRGYDFDERRAIALVSPNITLFNKSDLEYIDRAIDAYWDLTGGETSDVAHGVAWKSRADGEPMPYELAYLSDEPISSGQKSRLLQFAFENHWNSE